MKYQTLVNGQTFDIEINEDGRILVNGEVRAVDFRALRQGELYSMLLDHRSYEAVVDERDDLYHVLLAGDMYDVQVTDERSRRRRARSWLSAIRAARCPSARPCRG